MSIYTYAQSDRDVMVNFEPGPSRFKGWIPQLVSLILIHWVVIYPVDRGIQRLNNRAPGDYIKKDNFSVSDTGGSEKKGVVFI